MNKLIPISAIALAAASIAFATPQAKRMTADEKAVHESIENYVLAFYEARPERLEDALSPDVQKMGYWREDDSAEYQGPSLMTFDQATSLATTWNAGNKLGELEPFQIKVYDVADKTACGKLIADWGQDYLHLVKEDDTWKIHQILWQSPPVEERTAEASAPTGGGR
ncbi:nuclear transport factor 2 family protein [Engelhardtia mirabilis]|uniref:Lumazine-binding protein n=1 Tax=Engelhardtia mirabilis TaxID=2528011 RepID=A0A518BRQ7_9BACT|nr:Putative lumazine-binding protein [Planctomycetes bacterium Pla133]QDV03983.1 Putative lumazine-binding protein [Planctomycetes bacterium Pla86]